MEITDFENRLERLTITLSHLLDGDFDSIDDFGELADDPLGRIEETVQFLIMDIKTVTIANRDKEASLLMQQEEIAAKSDVLETQRRRIQQQADDLEAKAATIEQQAAAILELSTPVLEIWDKVIVLPIIGVIDTRRSIEIMSALLDNISRSRSRWVIIDITGVEFVDTTTAQYLIKVCRAAGMLGATCLLSGIRPAVARTLVEIGVELAEILTKRSLEDALNHCLAAMHDA